MDLTVDKLEQMFQNAEVGLEVVFRRMKWEMQQDNNTYSVDPLLVLQELDHVRGRVCQLSSELQSIREEKRRLEEDVSSKMQRITHIHTAENNRHNTAVVQPTQQQPQQQEAPDVPEAPAAQNRRDKNGQPTHKGGAKTTNQNSRGGGKKTNTGALRKHKNL
ncbi:spindle and kinetochore-associated protein 2 [Engraulis encrasicolus]|uniref:spindle and kinetochore-associated protein 2 n=1 Tax=Engraulis encrasicolus TaxID=184585 RepID=UPI002FD666E4